MVEIEGEVECKEESEKREGKGNRESEIGRKGGKISQEDIWFCLVLSPFTTE